MVTKLVTSLASLKFSLAILLLLLGGLPLSAQGMLSNTVLLTVAGLLFIINIGAALQCHTTFRSQPGLLVFHTALVVILGTAVTSRLTYFKGAVELTQGEIFSGYAQSEERGIWHADLLKNVRFRQDGFTVDYGPGLKRGITRNQVTWQEGGQRTQSATIGDGTSLNLADYRFRTTANKGFAPVFLWIPADGSQPSRASLHLPSYPAILEQVRHWRIPQTAIRIKVTLLLDEELANPEKSWQLHLPRRYRLKLETGDGSVNVLKDGSTVRFSEGVLVFEGLRSWMGYRIHYDPAMNWLLASCLAAIFGLAWHYYKQFSIHHWTEYVSISEKHVE